MNSNSKANNPLLQRVKRNRTLTSIPSPNTYKKMILPPVSPKVNSTYKANVFNWNAKNNVKEKKEITNFSLKVSGLIGNKIFLNRSK